MIIAEKDVASWAGAADVVVVGYGIAGACAAIEARELGARVLVLERAGGCDGSTVYSGGLLYLGGGTAVQKACGFDDTPEAMAAYLNAITVAMAWAYYLAARRLPALVRRPVLYGALYGIVLWFVIGGWISIGAQQVGVV